MGSVLNCLSVVGCYTPSIPHLRALPGAVINLAICIKDCILRLISCICLAIKEKMFGRSFSDRVTSASAGSSAPIFSARSEDIREGYSDVSLICLSYLGAEDLGRCKRISKQYREIANNTALWSKLVPESAFGKAQWEKCIGDVGIEPKLPDGIHKILGSPCPILRGKKVKDTHMLMLIPSSVNGVTLTLDVLGELVRFPKEGLPTRFDYGTPGARTGHFSTPVLASHWVLMTKDVLPGSRSKSFLAQQAQVAQLAVEASPPYQVPNLLDVVTVMFMRYVSSGECLLGRDQWAYTRCQESFHGYPI